MLNYSIGFYTESINLKTLKRKLERGKHMVKFADN